MKMTAIKKKYPECNKILFLLQKIDLSVNDKLSYAAKKLIENVSKAMKTASEDIDEKIQELNIDHAATDKTSGVLLVEENGNFKYTPEGYKKLNKAIKNLNNQRDALEIKITPFFAKVEESPRIKQLDLFIQEELKGVLFE